MTNQDGNAGTVGGRPHRWPWRWYHGVKVRRPLAGRLLLVPAGQGSTLTCRELPAAEPPAGRLENNVLVDAGDKAHEE